MKKLYDSSDNSPVRHSLRTCPYQDSDLSRRCCSSSSMKFVTASALSPQKRLSASFACSVFFSVGGVKMADEAGIGVSW